MHRKITCPPTLNSEFQTLPERASWSSTPEVVLCTSFPHPSTPLPQSHPRCSQTKPFPGPPTRSATPLPTSRWRGTVQLRLAPGPPGRSPGCSGRRWRELGQPLLLARAGAAGGGQGAPRGIVSKIRPLRASRKQLMRPRPLASLQPLTNGKWSSKSQAGQLPGTVTNVRTFPWKHYKGPRVFLTSARSAVGALRREGFGS